MSVHRSPRRRHIGVALGFVALAGHIGLLAAQGTAHSPMRFGIDLGVAATVPDADRWTVEGRAAWPVGAGARRLVVTLGMGSFSPRGLLGAPVADSLGFATGTHAAVGSLRFGLEQVLREVRTGAVLFGRLSASATIYGGQSPRVDTSVLPTRFTPGVAHRFAPGADAALGLRFGGRVVRPRVELRMAAEYYRGAGVLTYPVAAIALELRRNR